MTTGSLTVLRVAKRGSVAPETLRLPNVERDSSRPEVVFRRLMAQDLHPTHDFDVDRKRKPWPIPVTDDQSDYTSVHLVEAQIGEWNGRKRARRSLEVLGQQTLTARQFLSLTDGDRQTHTPCMPGQGASSNKMHASSSSYRQRMKRRAHASQHSASRIPAAVGDPLLRQVDHSLALLFSSSQTTDDFSQHLQLIECNWNLSMDWNQKKSQPETLAHYLNWTCLNGKGTFLHALVSANAIEPLIHCLSLYGDLIDMTATDAHGRTPHQISQTLPHTTIHNILDTYISQQGRMYDTTITKHHYPQDADELYDYYLLDIHATYPSSTKTDYTATCNLNTATEGLDLELHGAYGYFNDSGELVLEMTRAQDDSSDHYSDSDSNHENYIANDYPEEDDYYESYLDKEDESLHEFAYDSDLDGDHENDGS